MLRDCESWRMSPNVADYLTYGRLISPAPGANNSISTGGPNGDPYMNINGSNPLSWTRRRIPGGPFGTLIVGARICLNANGNGSAASSIAALDLVNGLTHVTVSLAGGTGVVSVSNSGGLLIQTSPGIVPIGVWFYFEVQFTIGSGTAGSVVCRVSNTTVLTLTGVNTQNGSRALCDTTQFIKATGAGSFFTTHIYWADTAGSRNNTFIGDSRVYGGLPTAAGDETDFTPVGHAANWQNAASVPPAGDADYNVSPTVGAMDLYKGSTPSSVTSVAGVMVSSLARKDDAGARSFANVIKSGGAVGAGATVPMADSYALQSDVFETDPSTGAAFTAGALGSLQFGGKVAA